MSTKASGFRPICARISWWRKKVNIDLKAKDQVTAIDKLKVLTYLRLLDLRLGLAINFHVAVLKDGVHRVVNKLLPPPPPEELPDLRA